VVDEAGAITGEVAVLYGEFLTNLIDFIIVAFVMFMLIKAINKTKKQEAPAPAAPKGPTQEELLIEIRDLLSKK
jgi:large conductance mechanosensitive channel